MIQLNEKYNHEDFLDFLIKDFLPDFDKDVRPVNCKGLTIINEATYLGQSKSLDLYVFELSYSETHANKRVALATDGFRIMQSTATFNALIVFNPQNKNNWRLSFMTATPEKNEKGGVSTKLSNPRRYSFELGENTKINTPYNFLIKKGAILDFVDLQKRFSIEVVNKEFYSQIAELFTELVGGTRGEGRNQKKYPGIIQLPSVPKESNENQEFAVRLIGRLIFCWFLREKKSTSELPLISKDILSLDAANNNPDYYHSVLEPLFFEVLNKPFKLRGEEYRNHLYGKTPYLNGGLFTPQTWDYYDPKLISVLKIPDEWIRKLFEVLELYNFTVDENTSIDVNLSIDPEMLGRIFENLLAEINPETGETARKSTGSYYTPRSIVDYMIDESLVQYLKNKTNIKEDKLRALVSYDLNDDEQYNIDSDEKNQIIEPLSSITILDPACGSGAFPIGALQKIVFILQQIDPEAKLWFQKQIEASAPEIRRILEREFAERNFDYIRKLGIIRKSIFGVDIQPIATEIARLRCFLTLVVDERVIDEEENRGIEPLPNLDFKFVTANSLIGLPNQVNGQVGLFEDFEGINKLKELRDMFFNASGQERDELKLQFVQVQNKMFQKMISEARHAELTSKLSSWNPFSHEASDWFDPDWMFGIDKGFDVVIGNPPYGAELQKEFREWAKKIFETASGEIDSYILFVERSLKLLKEFGVLAFIIPDTWLTLINTEKFRIWILQNYFLKELVMLNGLVFQGGIVDTMLVFISKANHSLENKTRIRVAQKNQKISSIYELPIVSNQDQNNWIEKESKSQIKVFAVPEIEDLLKKIRRDSVKLGQLVDHLCGCKPYQKGKGKPAQTKEIVSKKPFTSTIKKGQKWLPLLRGNDVQHYYLVKKRPEWILYGEWLAETRSMSAFSGERILVQAIRNPGLKERIIATLVDRTFITRINVYSLFTKDKRVNIYFVLAIMNSKLMNWFLKKDYGLHTYVITGLLSIPIKNCSGKDQESLSDLVSNILSIAKSDGYLTDQISQVKVHEYEKQIDQLVYKLYDLTPEEIEIIEKN